MHIGHWLYVRAWILLQTELPARPVTLPHPDQVDWPDTIKLLGALAAALLAISVLTGKLFRPLLDAVWFASYERNHDKIKQRAKANWKEELDAIDLLRVDVDANKDRIEAVYEIQQRMGATLAEVGTAIRDLPAWVESNQRVARAQEKMAEAMTDLAIKMGEMRGEMRRGQPDTRPEGERPERRGTYHGERAP